MDERRDLVDREELRVALVASLPELDQDEWDRGRRSGIAVSVALLDAMPAVECPRGWTRDEVLAELDADPDAVCEVQNAFDGDWRPVERRIVADWHPEVRRYDVRVVRVAPEPEWVPLTQLVGRTIVGETEPVEKWHPDGYMNTRWRWCDGYHWHDFPEGTLNLETGQVAVRPKAAT